MVFPKIELGSTGMSKNESLSDSYGKAENDRILGCLVGGAAGDALGYAVEFMSCGDIVREYGSGGITEYSPDPAKGKAIISDDTQMTLFTAEGLLVREGDEVRNVYNSYMNWLITQHTDFERRPDIAGSELMSVPELFSRRAPGNTCLGALSSGLMGSIAHPINNSKGCGGVMRVSPVAFLNDRDTGELDRLAMNAAAITHGHPLGYLPAALLVHVLHKAIYENGQRRSLRDIISESVQEFSADLASVPYMDTLLEIVGRAVAFSENRKSDIENITALGEGWVAEETLAIAIYSALRHSDDFSAALVASVNHNGDSDSTGAVTGNILGAYLGAKSISAEWKDRLELYDLIVRTAAKFRV